MPDRYDRPRPNDDDDDLPTLFDIAPLLVLPPPGSIEASFDAFHAANPWVYDALRRLALDLVDRGRTRIGMKMLFEVVRWNFVRTTDDAASDFKVNNNYTARYSRLLMEKEPVLAGVFETRVLKSA